MIFTEYNNDGIYNEIKFVGLFDGKKVRDMNKSLRELLLKLFGPLTGEEYIECWKSKFNEKADIKIRINGDIKGISIKMGESNSIHQEHLTSITNYLLNIGVNNAIVNKLADYIIGDINGTRVDATTYKKLKKEDIIEIKKALSDLYIKVSLIIRFLFKGKESELYDADAIIHGTPNKFLWATKSEVLKYLIDYPDGDTINVKVGPLFIQSRNRNLKRKEAAKIDENYIQVKWYNIEKDLYFITKKRENSKKYDF